MPCHQPPDGRLPRGQSPQRKNENWNSKNEIRKSNHATIGHFPWKKQNSVHPSILLSVCCEKRYFTLYLRHSPCLSATGHYVVASPRRFTRKTQQINIWVSSLPSHQTVRSEIPSRRKSQSGEGGCSVVYTFRKMSFPKNLDGCVTTFQGWRD